MLKELNPLIHSQLRLAIMTLLLSVDEADFNYLSSAGYIEVTKEFIGKKTRTSCRMTEAGRKAFEEYVAALKTYIDI